MALTSDSNTRLQDLWLTLARVGWISIALLVVGVLVAAVPFYYALNSFSSDRYRLASVVEDTLQPISLWLWVPLGKAVTEIGRIGHE